MTHPTQEDQAGQDDRTGQGDQAGQDDRTGQVGQEGQSDQFERPVPRHAVTGPVSMVSASRSSLTATAPMEAAQQRATQVRSMLSGLRSGAEKGRRAARNGQEPGVPQPRHSNNPDQ
ncbi:hypothetical protein LR393_26080 [Kineosporia mesophila]|uniref:hypothetical protein n=1 Tax=Kineosporia mesophila TaxID=566012 RepID=UPI001E33883A|nr:hypothetical protein [Kineosporia mesophila]MCD5353550.1 hypothetical protein [Kineosporia mesophila]